MLNSLLGIILPQSNTKKKSGKQKIVERRVEQALGLDIVDDIVDVVSDIVDIDWGD